MSNTISKKTRVGVVGGVQCRVFFWCPGCDEAHCFRTAVEPGREREFVWTWDGNRERPTFSPSLKYGEPTRCHLTITAGAITYCSDAQHAYANRTVPIPDWPFADDFVPG